MFRPLVILGVVFVLTCQANAETPSEHRKAELAEKKRDVLRSKNYNEKKGKTTDEDSDWYLGSQPRVGSVGCLYPCGPGGGYGFKIVQVIDKNNVLGEISKPNNGEEIVWLNIPTEEMVDGRFHASGNQYFKVTGTKQYETLVGTRRTALVLEPTEKPQSGVQKEEEKERAKELADRRLTMDGKRRQAQETASPQRH